jgi:hypothetical protein
MNIRKSLPAFVESSQAPPRLERLPLSSAERAELSSVAVQHVEKRTCELILMRVIISIRKGVL